MVVTARSPKKGQAIIDSLDKEHQPDVGFAVVEDVGLEGAFDRVGAESTETTDNDNVANLWTHQVFQSEHKFDYVVHTASPCRLSPEDPVRDVLDPAIKGTTGILKSARAYAPSVKRVVITSSSAAVVNPFKHEKSYNESNWAPFTWEDALKPQNTYAASKVSPSQVQSFGCHNQKADSCHVQYLSS